MKDVLWPATRQVPFDVPVRPTPVVHPSVDSTVHSSAAMEIPAAARFQIAITEEDRVSLDLRRSDGTRRKVVVEIPKERIAELSHVFENKSDDELRRLARDQIDALARSLKRPSKRAALARTLRALEPRPLRRLRRKAEAGHRSKITRYVGRDAQRSAIRTSTMLFGLLAGLTALLVATEHLPINDAIHLAHATITTIGYGDISPKTGLGRLLSWTMGLGGIGLLGQAISQLVEYFGDKKALQTSGTWRNWNQGQRGSRRLRDCIVVLDAPKGEEAAARYLAMVARDLRTAGALSPRKPIVVVTEQLPSGLPVELQKLGVILIKGSPVEAQNMLDAGVENAKAIAILARDGRSDAITLNALEVLRSLLPEKRTPILAEVIPDRTEDGTPSDVAALGGTPIVAYHFLSQIAGELRVPGAAEYFHRLLNPKDERIESCMVSLRGTCARDLLGRLAHLGIVAGYRGENGRIERPHSAEGSFDATELFFIVPAGRPRPSVEDISRSLGLPSPTPEIPPEPNDTLDERPLIILNAPFDPDLAEIYLRNMLSDVRQLDRYRKRPIVLVTDRFGEHLPQGIEEQGVRLIAKDPTRRSTLRDVGIAEAETVVVLAAKTEGDRSDSETLQAIKQVRELEEAHRPRVIAEAVSRDSDRDSDHGYRMTLDGADAVLPPLRSEPAIATELNSAGSAEILHRWLSPDRGKLVRESIAPTRTAWRDLVQNLSSCGIALQYENNQGRLVDPPNDVDALIEVHGVFLLMHDPSQPPQRSDLEAALAGNRHPSPA